MTGFYVTITRNFERFQYFNFETSFLKNENLFQKLEYRFLIESTKIGNSTFPYKTKTNVKTNHIPRNGYETVGNIKVISIDSFKLCEVASKIDYVTN